MGRYLTTILMLCSLPAVAQTWTQEPAAFRKVPFGANEAAVRMAFEPESCFPAAQTGERRCSDGPPRNIGPVTTNETYVLANDSFVAAQLRFASGDYGYLHDVFVEKYGEPHDRETGIVTNLAGATFENETLTWLGPM
ncbi:MAG: hypothetical protein QOJ98_2362, partial [Acidobacteriota bacterium]|nr:hypothetical protein [Acidobacteriota bacterium]